MKKLAISALLVTMMASAGALELGISTSGTVHSGSNEPKHGYGLSLGQHFGPTSIAVEVDRLNSVDLTSTSIVGGYDVTKIAGATVTAKAGVSYLKTPYASGSDRYAGVVGAGVVVPVTTKVGITADYRYVKADSKASAFTGNTVLVGVAYAF